MNKPEHTDRDVLRALKAAVGSLPPAENTDRAQVASLGAAGRAAASTTPAERAAHVRHASIESKLLLAGLTLPPALYEEIEAHIAHEIEQALVARTAAGGVNWTVEARASLAADWLDHFVSSKLDTPFFTREMDEVRTFLAGQINAAIATDQAERAALSADLSELRAAVRAWATADTTHEGEEALYKRVLELAGVESATPAGPPVAAAGAGLDVERLVEALVALICQRDAEDTPLTRAFHTGVSLARLDGEGLEAAMRIGLHALVLAALGIEPVERPTTPAELELLRRRLAETHNRIAHLAGIIKDCPRCYDASLGVYESTTTRPQAAPSEEAQDVE